eukprot:Rhum_TRINITY_DN14888_c2_g4::Rhum_TRINITY_DN14888_c2_g4_i1::g.125012::m.125012
MDGGAGWEEGEGGEGGEKRRRFASSNVALLQVELHNRRVLRRKLRRTGLFFVDALRQLLRQIWAGQLVRGSKDVEGVKQRRKGQQPLMHDEPVVHQQRAQSCVQPVSAFVRQPHHAPRNLHQVGHPQARRRRVARQQLGPFPSECGPRRRLVRPSDALLRRRQHRARDDLLHCHKQRLEASAATAALPLLLPLLLAPLLVPRLRNAPQRLPAQQHGRHVARRAPVQAPQRRRVGWGGRLPQHKRLRARHAAALVPQQLQHTRQAAPHMRVLFSAGALRTRYLRRHLQAEVPDGQRRRRRRGRRRRAPAHAQLRRTAAHQKAESNSLHENTQGDLGVVS